MSGELFLLAEIAGEPVAIPSDQVESVVDIGEVTPVPLARPHVLGLAALRSRVVTVVDARSAMGGPGADASGAFGRAVITRVDGHHYALVVDTLDDVRPFEPLPLTDGVRLDPAWLHVARGIVERDGRPVLIADLTAIVPGHVEP